jgi:diaminopimelate epimerase
MSTRLPFIKMHGAGNDFVMLSAKDLDVAGVTESSSLIMRLCDRRRGVGADGLIVVRDDQRADFAMTYYNSDGGGAEMCGNGARCAFAYARDLGLIGADGGVCATGSGDVHGTFADAAVTVELTPPHALALNVPVETDHPFEALHFVNTGVPHLVIPVPELETINLPEWGRPLRNDPAFAPGGANVNWVTQQPGADVWLIRTYERGVEAETLACGTGASAAALILHELGLATSPVALLTRGGDRLTIHIDNQANEPRLRLSGPAVVAFSGEVVWDD